MFIDSSIDAVPSRAGGWDVTRVLPREEKDTCHPMPNSNVCEKPAPTMGATMVVLIVAAAVAVCFILAFLCYLHRRRMRMDRLEDVKDVQELDDYGIAPSKPQPASRMPQAPPPAYTPTTDRGTDEAWRRESRRDSADSLTPSLRQAMGVVPRDTLANK
ncbi:hypothetical protein NCS52_00171500 [Fusarium sp. LHS14.1]|nr:hypothetical protein NCS52_00171500 [Fusarium sp. LHS14.1]